MTSWTIDELDRTETSDELKVAPQRRSGDLRKLVPIWSARVGDDLSVRAAYGPETGWYRVARGACDDARARPRRLAPVLSRNGLTPTLDETRTSRLTSVLPNAAGGC